MAQKEDGLITAVLDTSSLFSPSNRKRFVEASCEGRFNGVWSPHIIGELYRVLTQRWIRKNGPDAESLRRLSRASKDMMDVLLLALILQDTTPDSDQNGQILDDADDEHLIVAATRSGAEYIVSENTNDFPNPNSDGQHIYNSVEFITAAQLFDKLDASEAVEVPRTFEQKLLDAIFAKFQRRK